MAKTARPAFTGGRNIAMKIPPHEYDSVVAFYRDVLGLPVTDAAAEGSIAFEFGPSRLWIDRVAEMSQAELWLEIDSDDTAAAADHLAAHGIVRCDEIEKLPADLDGFWIANPANIVHLVVKEGTAP